MDSADLAAIGLTIKLASLVTVLLLLVGTPIAWWLARTRSPLKAPVGAVVALPLVLPPTVLGFYLLVAMGPSGPVGRLTEALGLNPTLILAAVQADWELAAAAERRSKLEAKTQAPKRQGRHELGGTIQSQGRVSASNTDPRKI